MKVEYYREYSPTLGRDMEYKVFGHAGKPCIAFPCQNGRFYDYENRGLIEAMRWYIDQGRIQVFCVDSIDWESWSAEQKDPRSRIEAQESYYNYILYELVHRVYEINTYGNCGGVSSGIMTFGCSMGAYHALNFFMRKPDIFDAVLALSWIYHSGYFFKNYADDLTFLNCACKFTEKNNIEGNSKRKEIKNLIKELRKVNKNVDHNIFKALDNVNLNCILGTKKDGKYKSFLEDYNKCDKIKV